MGYTITWVRNTSLSFGEGRGEVFFSAVLGGCQSCDNGFNYAGVFGQGVVAQAANTFHVECLNTSTAPNIATGPVAGTLAFVPVTAGMAAIGFPVGGRVAVIA